MILGRGLLAQAFESAFKYSSKVIIFASGVSNSQCQDSLEFEREKSMISDQLLNNKSSLFVYFSSTSIFDPELQLTKYVAHKKFIEEYLLNHETSDRILIFRLPIIAGRTANQHTLLNYLAQKILSNTKFDIFTKAYRNIIDIDDIVKICTTIIESNRDENKVFNVCNPESIRVLDLVKIMERILDAKANFNIVEKGGSAVIDMKNTLPFIENSGVRFGSSYLNETLTKYYCKK